MNLYPYCTVRSHTSNRSPSYVGGFTQDDTMNPAFKKTTFAAEIQDQCLVIYIRCEQVKNGQKERLILKFDPDHSGRRPNNLLQVDLDDQGRCQAAKMQEDIVRLTPLQGIKMQMDRTDGVLEFTVKIPMDWVRPRGVDPCLTGLNIIRMSEDTGMSKWSGLPGELYLHALQGAGDLIFIEDMSEQEEKECIQRAVAHSNTYYTRWEKQKLPDSIRRYKTKKKHGMTLRIKPEDVAPARQNAKNTIWGKAIAERIFEVADYWAAKEDDELYDLVPVGNPRAMTPSQFFGDPLTGGNRSTLATCLETPYRFYNKETGQWWFPGLKITNPATLHQVVVQDEGEGFLQPEGFANPYTRCMLVAAYRGFVLGMLMGAPYCPVIEDTSVVPNTSGLKYAGAITNLAYAYLLSNERKYAYKAAILIGRIAEIYPYMNGGYHDGSYSDTVHILEPSTTGTELKKNLLEAYDIIYDAIDGFHDELQTLFQRKPDAQNKQRTIRFDLKQAVECEMIPYVIYACELERSGASDWSMRLLELEMLVASMIQNGALLQHVLIDSRFSLFSKLINGYYRDGKYAYDSSSYVEGMSLAMMNYPNWVHGFCDHDYFREPLCLFEDHRFSVKEAISLYFQYRCGSLSAAFGDIGVDNNMPIGPERKAGLTPYTPAVETLYRRMPSMKDTIGKWLANFSKEQRTDFRIRAGSAASRGATTKFLLLAHALLDEEIDTYKDLTKNTQESYLLQDSEISMLRAGSAPSNTKHVVLYGQPTLPHCHGDKLGLWIGAFGAHLLAFGGHYPYIWIGPKVSQWELHSASCNVVLIDGKNQAASSSVQLEHYEGDLFQIAGMRNTEAYPDSRYERWTWMIHAPDGKNAYIADRFFVSSGHIFDYNTHGLDVTHERVEFENVESWIPMQGTLAGPDVPLYSKPGYGWMKAIKKAKITEPVTWRYPYGHCALKITALPSSASKRELIVCSGEKGGFEMKKSPWDAYVLIRDRDDQNPMRATDFTTVMEPYENKPFLRSVRPMQRMKSDESDSHTEDLQPYGIEVHYEKQEFRDVIIDVPSGRKVTYVDSLKMVHTSDARALLLRYQGNTLIRYEALGYTTVCSGALCLQAVKPFWAGEVESVDVSNRKVVIRMEGAIDQKEWIQNAVGFINSSDYKKPSPYYLRDVSMTDNRLEFYVDIPLIRGETNWPGSEKRRVQDGKAAITVEGRSVFVDIKPKDRFFMRNRNRSQPNTQ